MRYLSNKYYERLRIKIKPENLYTIDINSTLIYCNSIAQIEVLNMLGLFNSLRQFDPSENYLVLLNTSACDKVLNLEYAIKKYSIKYKVIEFKVFFEQLFK